MSGSINDNEKLLDARSAIAEQLNDVFSKHDLVGWPAIAMLYGSDGNLNYAWRVRQDIERPDPTYWPPLYFPPGEQADPDRASLLYRVEPDILRGIADTALGYINMGRHDQPSYADDVNQEKRMKLLWAKVAERLTSRAATGGQDYIVVTYAVDVTPDIIEEAIETAKAVRQAALSDSYG